MIIQKQDCKMDVDVDKTFQYYREHPFCDCPACRNFYAQVASVFPNLTAFLSELGVDASRPDETGWDVANGIADYHFVAYTVNGKILEHDKYEIDMQDGNLFLNIVIDDRYIPNEQKDEYFVVFVYGIKLPWVLDKKDLDEKVVENNTNDFWRKIKNRFKRK